MGGIISALQASLALSKTRGDALRLRCALPWLSYIAPLAL